MLSNEYKEYIENIGTRAKELALAKLQKVEPVKNTKDFFKDSIIPLFGGNVVEQDGAIPARYTPDESGGFTITCDKDVSVIDLAHELGHHFLLGHEAACDAREDPIEEMAADYFAKSFLLPKKPFMEQVVKNSIDGRCDVVKISEIFDTPYFIVECRGKDLNIWSRCEV